MLVILATNEPQGVYHSRPLLAPAARANIELRQWCEGPEGSRGHQGAPIITDAKLLKKADLIVVNGLASAHTQMAASIALDHNIPLAFCELAYLSPLIPFEIINWAAISGWSEATKETVALCCGCETSRVTINGWPQLDNLPIKDSGRSGDKSILALTTVSGEDDHNIDLRELLQNCGSSKITVRPHPRENKQLWRDWPQDHGCDIVDSLHRCDLVIGVCGTATLISAAMGKPWITPNRTESIPGFLLPLTQPAGKNLLETIDQAVAPPAKTVDFVCGPRGQAGDNIMRQWRRAAENGTQNNS